VRFRRPPHEDAHGPAQGDQHGHRYANHGPERYLHDSVERVGERAQRRATAAQQHDDRGDKVRYGNAARKRSVERAALWRRRGRGQE